jgi:glycine betaine transporter
MNLREKNFRINAPVFWPPIVILAISIILSLVNFEAFTGVVSLVFYWITENFGWLFSLSSFSFVVILIIIFLSPVGKIKFGGENAKPTISTWNWFAMSLTAGIGFGLVFFAVAEPIYHFASPPASLGIEAFSETAALFSMSAVFLHWSFTPYALYAIIAIPIALAYYNHNQPFAVSSSLYFIMGEKCHGGLGKTVDALCLFAIAGGTAAILGGGIMQVGSGLNYVFGIQPSVLVWALVAIFIVAAYTLSSYTGLEKGIRFLADKNTKIFSNCLGIT